MRGDSARRAGTANVSIRQSIHSDTADSQDFFDATSVHDGVNDDAGGEGDDDGDEDENEDEPCGLCAGLLGWLGDAEGVDEGIGEEVEEFHSSYYALWCAGWEAEVFCIGWARVESNEEFGLAGRGARGID
jgi:hypothetical protein